MYEVLSKTWENLKTTYKLDVIWPGADKCLKNMVCESVCQWPQQGEWFCYVMFQFYTYDKF